MGDAPRQQWHMRAAHDVLVALRSGPQGLTVAEARRRLEATGPNEIAREHRASPFALLLGQFKNVLVIILLGGALLSGFLGHEVEAVAIAAIVLIAVVLGFVQEFRAERALEALRRLTAPTARVERDGMDIVIPTRELVTGDVILLSAGDRIPADGRLLHCANLRIEESALTGESLPVEKTADAITGVAADLPVGDRRNMIFAGTAAALGRGRAVITATGMATEFGRIASLLQQVPTQRTPLQKNLDRIGRVLAQAALGIVVVVTALGFLRGEPLVEILIFGVALAVAVVPEALPAVVTISLAIGVQRMARRHALIRKLHAVETLGCTSVICTDKTGTLTRDEMTVRELFVAGTRYAVSGAGYDPTGTFAVNGVHVTPPEHVRELLRACVLASDARLVRTGAVHAVHGDPTEGACIVAAAKAGLHRVDLDRLFPRVGEIPFTSESKRMTTLHHDEACGLAYTKGAPEVVLALCTRQWGETGEMPLTDADRAQVLAVAESMAGKALRVIAVARKGRTSLRCAHEGKKFLGLIAMMDPPRPEVAAAIRECSRAGIRVVMITGDHPVTARAIARELCVLSEKQSHSVVTGAELAAMDDAALARASADIAVYARVSPEHKLRIVAALQNAGNVVAMTGDGVNDAPALKRADIGIAMGITGTDVSKEAASMTLSDDNFASIVAAIEEGRAIFGNIAKYLLYLLSSNIGEILVVTVATLLGWPLPLTAVQLLYLNLATDGLPALALALDPPDPDLMDRRPRDPKVGVFTPRVILLLLVGSSWLAAITLGVYRFILLSGRTQTEAMAMAFLLLVLAEFVKAFNVRSDRLSVFRRPFRNRYLNFAICWELLLLLAIVYVPLLRIPFATFMLPLRDWLLLLALALTLIPVFECAKWLIRRASPR